MGKARQIQKEKQAQIVILNRLVHLQRKSLGVSKPGVQNALARHTESKQKDIKNGDE